MAPMTFNVGIYQDGTMASASVKQLHRLAAALGERQMRIYPNTSTKRQRVSPETHLLALRAGMNSPAARLRSLSATTTP